MLSMLLLVSVGVAAAARSRDSRFWCCHDCDRSFSGSSVCCWPLSVSISERGFESYCSSRQSSNSIFFCRICWRTQLCNLALSTNITRPCVHCRDERAAVEPVASGVLLVVEAMLLASLWVDPLAVILSAQFASDSTCGWPDCGPVVLASVFHVHVTHRRLGGTDVEGLMDNISIWSSLWSHELGGTSKGEHEALAPAIAHKSASERDKLSLDFGSSVVRQRRALHAHSHSQFASCRTYFGMRCTRGMFADLCFTLDTIWKLACET